jgi:DNA replication protein DnaC
MQPPESLPLLLKQLGLPSIYQHYQSQAEEAEKYHWSYSRYLSGLCDLELTSRRQKRMQRYIKESKLPPGKTLSQLDFQAVPSINPAQIEALAEQTDWVKLGNNVVLLGPSGVGKTHIAAAIGYRLIEQDCRVLFMSATAMVQKLQKARAEFKLNTVLARLARIPLLILDDISYVKRTEMATSVLFELIAERYESSSLIITSNQPFSEWDQVFPDSTMAVAAIDRLVHHAVVINVQGASYRKTHSLHKNL